MAVVSGKSVKFCGRHLFFFKGSRFAVAVFLTALAAFMMLPLLYMVITAFKPLSELYLFPPRFFVSRPTLSNFSDLFSAFSSSSVPFSRYVFNSLFVTVVNVVISVLVSSMGAFALEKYNTRGSKLIFSFILISLMLPAQAGAISNYILVRTFGLIDTYWSLIIPKIASAYNVFLMKQFLSQMPDSYLEAARIDGANEWTLYSKIVMPFLRPACATVVVFSFVANWNDAYSPMVYTTKSVLKTLPLAVQMIGGTGAASMTTAGAVAASTLITTAPLIIIYTIMQGRVLSTMAYSGVKA